MIRHAYFALVISFWVFMNVLLWRAEMSNKQADTGSPVPINLVWTRILTAPDDSPLDVFKNGQKLGHCRWWANIIETQKPPGLTESAGTNHIEGRVEHVAGYTLDLEGNVLIGPSQPRLRFTWHAEFDHKQSWRSFTIRLNTRQTSVEVRANADTQTLSFLTHDGQSSWQRTLTFTDLARPNALLRNLDLPYGELFLDSLVGMQSLNRRQVPTIDPGIQWDARSQWFEAGQARMRVYRLQASLFDKYKAVIYISRVGEILKAELPGDIFLMNEALLQLSNIGSQTR